MSYATAKSLCCYWWCGVILLLGFATLFIWLILLSAVDPVCSIQDFYVPALNKTANATSNHTIYLNLELYNNNGETHIYYNSLNLNLYYVNNTSKIKLPVANDSLHVQFDQAPKTNTYWNSTVETYGVPWTTALAAISNGSMVVFKVELSMAVRFIYMYKKHKLVVGADVVVNNTGVGADVVVKDTGKIVKNGISLKSGAPGNITPYSLLFAFFVLPFF